MAKSGSTVVGVGFRLWMPSPWLSGNQATRAPYLLVTIDYLYQNENDMGSL